MFLNKINTTMFLKGSWNNITTTCHNCRYCGFVGNKYLCSNKYVCVNNNKFKAK